MIASIPLLAWPRGDEAILTILIYHRVMPQADPLRIGEADAELFDRHMAFLSRHFAVLPLLEAVNGLKRGSLPRRACCITFDDGYADNLTVALPILERYRLPATVFVATGYLNGGRMFNDSVIELVARTTSSTLDFRQLGMSQYPVKSIEERRSAINALLSHSKYLPPAEREELVARMVEIAGCGPLPDDLMMTTAQVRELSDRGVEIGGHTHVHTILKTLDDDAAYAEIARGKARLEEITGKSVKVFAFPNGRPERDYTARHVGMMKELGFEAAVTTAYGVANRASDVYQLPRFAPWGRATTMFAARITRNAMLGQPASVC